MQGDWGSKRTELCRGVQLASGRSGVWILQSVVPLLVLWTTAWCHLSTDVYLSECVLYLSAQWALSSSLTIHTVVAWEHAKTQRWGPCSPVETTKWLSIIWKHFTCLIHSSEPQTPWRILFWRTKTDDSYILHTSFMPHAHPNRHLERVDSLLGIPTCWIIRSVIP